MCSGLNMNSGKEDMDVESGMCKGTAACAHLPGHLGWATGEKCADGKAEPIKVDSGVQGEAVWTLTLKAGAGE